MFYIYVLFMFYIYVLRTCKVLKNKALLIRTITKMVQNYNKNGLNYNKNGLNYNKNGLNYNKNGLNYYERMNFTWNIVIIKHFCCVF